MRGFGSFAIRAAKRKLERSKDKLHRQGTGTTSTVFSSLEVTEETAMSTNIGLSLGMRAAEPTANIPLRPYWLQRLPEIIYSLRALSVATIDRRTFESIFQLRRRRAIELMHLLGSYRARRGFVLDRSALIEKLESPDTIIHYRWVQQTPATLQNGHIDQAGVSAFTRQGDDHETTKMRGLLVG